MYARSTTVASDYWRLQIKGNGPHAVMLLEGRRRTTEPFWAPLELTAQQFERFVDTIGDAFSIVGDIFEDGRRPTPPMFPAYEIVAACQGSCYWLELTETSVADGKSSATVIVYSVQDKVRPVLHLIDDEIALFHEDLQRFQRLLASASAETNGSLTSHPVEPVVIAVRDAKQPGAMQGDSVRQRLA